MTFLLAIDQGTSSSRAIIFDSQGKQHAAHQLAIKQYYPHDGWVEHDPEEIWTTTLTCMKEAIQNAEILPKDICAIGITNQRETTILWDKKTGKTIYPAIVWQDRRMADYCNQLVKENGNVQFVSQKTGLLIDSYFSALKARWILDHVPGARKKAENGELAFGTVDTYLLWRLTGGKSFYTDATNASRTLLFNIRRQSWDDDLLSFFDIPKNLLPEVLDCAAYFGKTDQRLLGVEIPITGMAGDQQSAMIGQACFEEGMIKSTYGTGCFIVLNTGDTIVTSKQGLLATTAYRFNNKVTYALEGSIFSAGVAVKWLHENIKLISSPSECEAICSELEDTHGVYFVPAFTGLGAPYWNPDARAAIFGITRDTQISHIVRAALESVCYQTLDLLRVIQSDFKKPISLLKVDGGMSKNNWILQFLSNMINLPVCRPRCIETTALGAAFLAGLGVGLYQNQAELIGMNPNEKVISPMFSDADRDKFYQGWRKAIDRVIKCDG